MTNDPRQTNEWENARMERAQAELDTIEEMKGSMLTTIMAILITAAPSKTVAEKNECIAGMKDCLDDFFYTDTRQLEDILEGNGGNPHQDANETRRDL